MDILSGLSIIFLTQHMHKRNENLKLYLKYRVFIVTKYAFIRILFFEVTNNKLKQLEVLTQPKHINCKGCEQSGHIYLMSSKIEQFISCIYPILVNTDASCNFIIIKDNHHLYGLL